MPANFQEFAQQHKPAVDAWLANVFTSELQANQPEPYTVLITELKTLIGRGGKRLRPLICILAYQGYGGKDITGQAMPVAAAQELLHAFLLIHDDIIDRDTKRWGGLNITGAYFERYGASMTPRDALHFAQSQALIAGDICQNLVQQSLLMADLPPVTKLQLHRLFNSVTKQVLIGEMADIQFISEPPTLDAVLQMYGDKTASYSVTMPLLTGAIMTNTPKKEQTILQAIGQNLGLAYQLQDDLIGMYGDESKTGKPSLSDIREGKRTALVIKALQLASVPNRQRLERLLGDDQVGSNELSIAQKIITSSGAEQWVRGQIHDLTNESLASLDTTSMTAASKQQFADLINLLLTRQN